MEYHVATYWSGSCKTRLGNLNFHLSLSLVLRELLFKSQQNDFSILSDQTRTRTSQHEVYGPSCHWHYGSHSSSSSSRRGFNVWPWTWWNSCARYVPLSLRISLRFDLTCQDEYGNKPRSLVSLPYNNHQRMFTCKDGTSQACVSVTCKVFYTIYHKHCHCISQTRQFSRQTTGAFNISSHSQRPYCPCYWA